LWSTESKLFKDDESRSSIHSALRDGPKVENTCLASLKTQETEVTLYFQLSNHFLLAVTCDLSVSFHFLFSSFEHYSFVLRGKRRWLENNRLREGVSLMNLVTIEQVELHQA